MPETSTVDGGPSPQGERLKLWLEFLGKRTELRFFRFEMKGPAWVVLCGLALRVGVLLFAIYTTPRLFTSLLAGGTPRGAVVLIPGAGWPQGAGYDLAHAVRLPRDGFDQFGYCTERQPEFVLELSARMMKEGCFTLTDVRDCGLRAAK